MAAREATRRPRVTSAVLPSLRQAKAQARRVAAEDTREEHGEAERTKPQAAWYAQATAYQPLRPTQRLARADQVVLHRLRLGYCTRAQLPPDFDSRQCEHCRRRTRRPLKHYLLSCPAMARLRPQRPAPPRRTHRLRSCSGPATSPRSGARRPATSLGVPRPVWRPGGLPPTSTLTDCGERRPQRRAGASFV